MKIKLLNSKHFGYFLKLLLLLSVSPFISVKGENIKSGLHFYSYTVDKDKRTGLNLTPDKPLTLLHEFTLTFDFKIRAGESNYGSFFRIIGNDSINIDLISNFYYDQLFLVVGQQTVIQFSINEIPDFSYDTWMNIELMANLQENQLHLSINGYSKSGIYPLRSLKKFRVFFGRHQYKDFITTDVPPFNLKNIRIFDDKKQMIRNWQMTRHGQSFVLDECSHAKATVINALWEIDNHAYWKQLTTFTLASPFRYPQITFDSKRKKIWIAKNDRVYMYDITSGLTEEIKSDYGFPSVIGNNQILYDPVRDQLLSYEFEKNRLNRFDFQLQQWSSNENTNTGPMFAHHSKYYDATNRIIYTMGGYGFHQYSAFLQKYSEEKQQWEHTDLFDYIPPRYLASMGKWNDSLLLYFGGFGNISGKQYELPHNFYDLYSINMRTAEVQKLWKIESVAKDFTNSNSLVFNEKNQTFYTLSYSNFDYQTQIYLHEYMLNAPEFRILGDSIPFWFTDNGSYCDLFKPDDESELYAIASYSNEKTNENIIAIYSIAYPPLSVSETLQIQKNSSKSNLFLIAGIVSGMLVFAWGLLYGIKQIKRKKNGNSISQTLTFDTKQTNDLNPVQEIQNSIYPSIQLLDNFQMMDNQNMDISNKYSPTTKLVFFLLYFRTLSKNKGITSKELQRILWPDKNYSRAAKNQNVYIYKLRLLLMDVGNMQIICENNFWMIDSLVYSDYEQVMNTVSIIQTNNEWDKEMLRQMLQIAKKGKLLPLFENEWLDKYQTEYSNILIECLSKVVALPAINNDWSLLLDIADVILIQDSLEESGIKLKCKALLNLGRKRQAYQCYRKYVEEHIQFVAASPELTFEKILSE